MAQDTKANTSTDPASEYMRRGKGQKDDVRGSGIYPASASDVLADAQVRQPGEFVRHSKSPLRSPADDSEGER